MSDEQKQIDRFKELAHEPEADKHEARWDERLSNVAAYRCAPEKLGNP